MATQRTDFSLSVNVNPDTSQVQRTLNRQNFTVRTRLEIDAENIQNAVNRMFQQPQIAGFDKINTKIREGLTVVKKYKDGTQETFTNATRYVETFKNAIGTVYERVTTLTHGGQVLNSSLKEIQRGVVNVTTETNRFNQIINGVNTSVTQVTKTTTDANGNISQITENTYKWLDANGRLVTSIEKLDQDGRQIAPVMTTIGDNFYSAGEQALLASENVKNLGSTLSTTLLNFAKTQAIILFRKLLNETITTLKEFDSALVEFRKVSDLSGDSLTRYTQKLARMGELTGSTMTSMVEAATEFRKSGFSDEDSARLASIAEKYRNIADESVSAGEAASFIIAQMKAFNIEAEQAEHIIDSVNEVANNFAVSSADISKNLGNMSEIMAINNVSLEQQIGMLTGVTEITRKASSASRGLVMISSRLTQVLDENSSTGKKLTAVYDKLGIALKDESGQLRSHYEILGDLAKQWDNLSENEQKYIALTSAGARQQQNFVALMDNWNQVAKATATAYASMGSAQKENEKVMDSLGKKVEILKSQFQQLVIGGGELQSVGKGLLNIGIAILQFLNSDFGKFTVILLAVEAATISLTRNWDGLIAAFKRTGLTQIISEVIALRNGEVVLTGSTLSLRIAQEGLAKVLWETAAAWIASPMGIATIAVAAIAALAYGTYKWNKRLEESAEKLNELSDEAKNAKTELKNLEDALKTIQEQIRKNNELKLEVTDKDELDKLEKETGELEKQEKVLKRQLILQKQKAEAAEKAAEEQAKQTLQTTVTSQFGGKTTYDENFNEVTYGANVTPKEELKNAINAYKELKIQEEELIATQEKLIQSGKGQSAEFDEVSRKLQSTQTEMSKVRDRGIEMSDILETAAEAIVSTDRESTILKITLENLVDLWQDTTDYIDENTESLEEQIQAAQEAEEEAQELADEIKNLAESLGITATELEGLNDFFGNDENLRNYLATLVELKAEISDYNTVIDNLQDALDTAQTAFDEYNETGYLTLDTFQSLMGVSAQYLTALVNENGQLEVNQTTLTNLVEKLKDAKIQELQNAEVADILAYAQGNTAEMSALAQEAIKNAGESAKLAGQKASEGSNGFWELTDALVAARRAAGYSVNIQSGKGLEAIHNSYRKLYNEIRDTEVKVTDVGKASSKAGKKGAGAAKQAKDATKELNKELEETKKKYETVIKWISKQYDKEIDKIKKAEKEALKAEEAKIKAKEKEKDNALDAIEKEIDALEKEKDARKKYWDNQIDALKKQNEAQKDALELQEKLDALERARNTRVKIYKEGQGFVYDVDQTAVAEAQKELDEYLSEKAYEDELERLEALRDAEMDNYEQRLDALNDYKDKVQEAYEAEIEALNEHKEKLQEQYEAEIEIYENYKQQFEDMVNAYEEEQNRLLAQQLTGIDFENKNWMTRLDNLAAFVNEYNKLQKQLDTGNTSVSNSANLKGGGSAPTTTGNKNSSSNLLNPQGSTRVGYVPTSVTKAISTQTGKSDTSGRIYLHANGTPSVKSDEIAIVGENPNQEIVIGSKINNGELMNLGKGTGVINADSSKTLAGMLNQVGQFGASGFGSGNGTLNNNINNDSLTINGVTIQGANINDPQTFVNGLLSLKSDALQRAYRHR